MNLKAIALAAITFAVVSVLGVLATIRPAEAVPDRLILPLPAGETATPATPTPTSDTGCPLSVASTGVVIPDADPSGVQHCITETQHGVINDLDVGLDIAHPFVGDLVVELTHDDTGTSVTLIYRPGVPALGALGCGHADIDVQLDDDAALAAQDQCSAAPPAIGGTLRAKELLSRFNGQDFAGTWRLQIVDQTTGNQGSLLSWTLKATVKDAPTPTPTRTPTPVFDCGDVNKSGDIDAIDAALILQYSAGLTGSINGTSDIDGNGTVNAIDAALVLQHTAGLIDAGDLEC
jgi:subtilisin-like proprotein convertase family protein